MASQKTFVAIKPDGVERGLVGKIIGVFEKRGQETTIFTLLAVKLTIPSRELVAKHYAEHDGKPFFEDTISYMTSGPVCAMIWEGGDAVQIGRTLIGATIPTNASSATIRGDYAINIGRNVVHGSDTIDSAEREIGLWFEETEKEL